MIYSVARESMSGRVGKLCLIRGSIHCSVIALVVVTKSEPIQQHNNTLFA